VNDSDHSYWEMWLRTPQENRDYIWENVLRGNSVLFMDPYLVYYPRQKRNMCGAPKHGICSKPDSRYDVFRDNLGDARKYASKLNLQKAMPHADLSTTGYCLAQTPERGAEYLAYSPSGGAFALDLSAMSASRMLNVEWLNPATGERVVEGAIAAGERAHSFTPPFRGDAVLYLVDSEGHAQ
jgi:Putative collagen-binding domain of a collagenase